MNWSKHMTWSKLYDALTEDPRMLQVGHRGLALYAGGLGYASRNLTDGYIPSAALPRLAIDLPKPKAVAEALVAVGLWEHADGGYQVCDYVEQQRTREQVQRQRDRTAGRQADFRQRRRNDGGDGGNGVSNGESNGVSNRESNGVSNGESNGARNGPVTPLSHVQESEREKESETDPAPGERGARGRAPLPPHAYESEVGQILSTLPGWDSYGKSEQHILKWLGDHRIDMGHAVDTAQALKAKWGGPGWRYRDPWATFQRWVKRPPLGNVGGGYGKPGVDFVPYREDIERQERGRRDGGPNP